MGFFKKLFSKLQNSPPKNTDHITELPAEIELIPNELWVEVAIHTIPKTKDNSNPSGLSFLTRGMTTQGQQELFFVLKTNKTALDDVPQEPLYFFQQVYKLATQGKLATEGSITQFGQKDLWGWKGIVYTQVPVFLKSQLPQDCLCMVLLSLDEVEAIRTFGYTRILSMLGKQARYYPFPYWTDHYRDNLPLEEVAQNTLLNKVRRMVLPEATVTMFQKQQHLYLNIDSNTALHLEQEAIPSNIPMALLPRLSDKADACLTWSFSPNTPEAITLPNSKGAIMGGCMLLCLGEQPENIVRILEDGFALLLTNTTWTNFWQAIKDKTAFTLNTSQEYMDFSLTWD